MFAVIGTQLFNGLLYNRCRLTEEPISNISWPIIPDNSRRCTTFEKAGYVCPSGTYCGNPLNTGYSI